MLASFKPTDRPPRRPCHFAAMTTVSQPASRKRRRFWQAPRRAASISTILPIVLHIISAGIYIRPLTSSPTLVTNPPAVLDEAHIVSDNNPDVAGTSTLRDVFVNDYWGRPITNNPSTHKSWRPLTILSFRWLNGGGILGWSPLFVHRIVNVLIHAAASETCSIAATLLFPDLGPTHTTVLRAMTKLLFALHPAHVEVVANAANRPHIMAVLLSSLMLDPASHLVLVAAAEVGGLLCSETAIFQLPGVLATITVIKWKRDHASKAERNWRSFFATMVGLIPRYFVIIFFGLIYLGGRKYFDTLSIPDGLIRPAENPFYALAGKTRLLTYALLLAIHAGKAVLIDPIGFSHEYGFECIRNVVNVSDARLLAPFAIYVGIGLVTLLCSRRGAEATITWAVALAWLLTLFPVSGAIKVGTSIADRIVVPTTFAFAIFAGRFLTALLLDEGDSDKQNENRPTSSSSGVKKTLVIGKVALISLLFGSMYNRVHRRSLEWMDSLSLLESSLKSCPRSAKSNLEISKIYSGLYKEKFDLDKAISYLEKAESIDPDYCDINYQFAHCHVQQGKYLEFEKRLTNALLCPFTMGQAIPLWQNYWKQVTSDPRSGVEAKARMDKYQAIINEAVEKEQQKEDHQQLQKPQAYGGDEL